jgi:hypothetical protein
MVPHAVVSDNAWVSKSSQSSSGRTGRGRQVPRPAPSGGLHNEETPTSTRTLCPLDGVSSHWPACGWGWGWVWVWV